MMIRTLLLIAIMGAVILVVLSSDTQTMIDRSNVTDQKQDLAVDATAWGIYDTVRGTEIASHNAHTALPIASITKLFTADVLTRNYNLDTTTTISHAAIATEGRAGRLTAGDVLTLRELLFPLLLESSNDAAAALTQVSEDRSFIEKMNTYVRDLELHNTVFVDGSGLSDQNRSSVQDIAHFVSNIKHTNHYILDISRLGTYVTEEHAWQNNNYIHTKEGYHGGKHGYTEESGRTLAVVFEEELADGIEREITYVLLNSPDPETELARMRSFVQEQVLSE